MKRRLLLLLMLCVLPLAACRKNEPEPEPAPPPAPAVEPVPAEPAPAPPDERVTADNYYSLLAGSWRMTSGETEGWEYDAREGNVEARLVFRPEGYALYRYADGAGNTVAADFRAPAYTAGRLWELASDWFVTLSDDLLGQTYVAGLDGDRLVFADEDEGGVMFFEREDAPKLLDVTLYATREEAAAADPLAFYDIEPRPEDEAGPRYWAVIAAAEDGTRVRLERAARRTGLEEILAQDGFFLPGERCADITLGAGGCIAARVSLPWTAELRVTASRGAYYGEYSFGSDNYLHLDPTGVTRSVFGAASVLSPADEYDLHTLLAGTWVLRDAGGGTTASLTFDRQGLCTVSRGEDSGTLMTWFDRLYAGDADAPDLLCLSPNDDALALLPDWFADAGGGDYLMDLVQCDGELLLRLSQANNGDGALEWLLPHGEDGGYVFLLHRYTGATDAAPEHDGPFFPAIVWKCDADEGLLWLQPLVVSDEDEAGYAVYRPDPASPAAPYPAADEAAAVLSGFPDPVYPGEYFDVTVREDGAVAQLD